jgi:hypothetical protein
VVGLERRGRTENETASQLHLLSPFCLNTQWLSSHPPTLVSIPVQLCLTGPQQFIFLVIKPSNKLKEEKKVSMHNLCPVTDVCAAIIVKFQISKCERTGKRVVMMYFQGINPVFTWSD